MQKTFEAVFENGVLRPLVALSLPNLRHVQVTISETNSEIDDAAVYFEPGEWEASKHDSISLEEVRQALSGISGSLADAVIEAREERS